MLDVQVLLQLLLPRFCSILAVVVAVVLLLCRELLALPHATSFHAVSFNFQVSVWLILVD